MSEDVYVILPNPAESLADSLRHYKASWIVKCLAALAGAVSRDDRPADDGRGGPIPAWVKRRARRQARAEIAAILKRCK